MSTTAGLIVELLDLAPELEGALGEAWPATRDRLAELASRIDSETDENTLRRDLDSLLARLLESTAAKVVRRSLLEHVLATRTLRSPSPAPIEVPFPQEPLGHARGGRVVVPVFYATDRLWRENSDPRRCYTGERGTLGFGVATVSVPGDHRIGELEYPRWWRLEFRPDAAKHVVLLALRRMDEEDFAGKVRVVLGSAAEPEALVFVHGYNVRFVDAARRAAQLAVDLKFPGAVLLYSWPSLGETRLYPADEATVEWSTPHFEQFLELALTRISARCVHVIAHSMGNRPLVDALERLKVNELPAGAASLRQIIFAAPDVDRDVFREVAAAFRGQAHRFTLYASSNDLALKVSKLLHRYPRAGDAGEALLIADGLDTIDASEADTSLFGLGHSYFAQRRSILSDIHRLIRNGEPPDARFDLISAVSRLGRYWTYRG